MLGNVIADQLTKSRNWPLASAISLVLTVVTTVGVLLMMGLQKRDAVRLADGRLSDGRLQNGSRAQGAGTPAAGEGGRL
jgi:spermidine/putrescine transport system permease protein